MANIELSDYVTGLSSATLDGSEEVYLVGNEKTTTQDIADLGNSNIKVYKAQISQTGISAPTLTTLRDDFGLTLTPAYSAVGVYTISGFNSNLTGLIETDLTSYANTTYHILSCLTSSQLKIETFTATIPTDGLLTNSGTTVGSSVLTIVKYD